MTRPLSLKVYAAVTGMLEPVAPLWLGWRERGGKEERARMGERLGHADIDRPFAPLVWVHGASVGESLSVLPLVERLAAERPDAALLVTSGTRTSADLLAERLPDGAIHQYLPLDAPVAARRFISRWRPDLSVFVESELWPNLLEAAKAAGSRLALLSAQVSPSSAAAWDRAPAAARHVLGLFDLIAPRDEATEAWARGHGATVGERLDLKRAGAPLPHDDAELTRLRAALGGRLVVTAASTHPGEDMLIVSAVARLSPRPLLALVPRHPERGEAIARSLAEKGIRVARRSAGETPGPDTEVYLADTLGELGLFYRLGDVAVVGGSFAEGLTGHNPLEPARLGRAVVSGPHVASFAALYDEMKAASAVLIARDEADLTTALSALMAEPTLRAVLAERAGAVATRGEAAFETVLDRLLAMIPPPREAA